MKRYKKFVFMAEDGITFDVSNGIRGEVIIKAVKLKKKAEGFSENYMNPPIPDGYKHLYGEWNNGFVIERSSDKSQFVWIPVGSLKPNGTIDGKKFSKKFGRRNFNDISEFEKYQDLLNEEFSLQIKSVEKYGGFYISRYNISQNDKDGKPQSIMGKKPMVYVDFYYAKNFATLMETNYAVRSHLIFGAEYDSVLEWFLESGIKTENEIGNDSSEWGNCNNNRKLEETGSRNKWCANNIYDFAGNVEEWTQEYNEEKDDEGFIVRGGEGEYKYSVSVRKCKYLKDSSYNVGFRVGLYVR